MLQATTLSSGGNMTDDLKKAFRKNVLAKALQQDQCPLELVAKQLGCTELELVRMILQVVRERLDATAPPPNAPPTSTSIH
jgi:hypothetical protein